MSFQLVTRYAAVLWFGLMAGFFFAYSMSVPDGLLAASPKVAMEAMQAINAEIRTFVFAAAFFGAAVIAVLLAGSAVRPWSAASTPALIAAALYLFGVFAVTAVGNVPMNQAFATADPDAADVAEVVADYFRDWTALNHVRTIASLAALLLAAVSLRKTPA